MITKMIMIFRSYKSDEIYARVTMRGSSVAVGYQDSKGLLMVFHIMQNNELFWS